MDAEQMELLERLARLRDLGAISRREFLHEKEAVLRAPARPATVHLRALPAPGAAAAAVTVAAPRPTTVSAPPRPRPSAAPPTPSLFGRLGRYAGWILWTLFSVGGLHALANGEPLEALSLLLCGLLISPPLHRLLATRLAFPTRLAITFVGLVAALGIGTAPPGHAAGLVPLIPSQAASACGQAVSDAAGIGAERAREGIARPWRKLWNDVVWARAAGHAALLEWQASRG